MALGSKASDEVMAELLQKLVPGTLPHYFVVLTLANLATENGKSMSSHFLYIYPNRNLTIPVAILLYKLVLQNRQGHKNRRSKTK